MGKFTFPRQARIVRKRDFEGLRRRGRPMVVFPLRLRVLRKDEGESRLGLAVGRKVGGAVVRNRWKRAIREAFRLHRHRLKEPYDMVVSVCREARPDRPEGVERAFLEAIRELNGADENTAETNSTD